MDLESGDLLDAPKVLEVLLSLEPEEVELVHFRWKRSILFDVIQDPLRALATQVCLVFEVAIRFVSCGRVFGWSIGVLSAA